MPEALPYARPRFLEHQKLLTGGYGRGTLLFLLFLGLAIATPQLWFAASAPGGAQRAWLRVLIGSLPLVCLPAGAALAHTVTFVGAGELVLAVAVGPVRVWRRTIPLASIRTCEVLAPGQRPAGRSFWTVPKFRGTALMGEKFGCTFLMVRGNRPSVVLTIGEASNIVIGSQRPDELADAIRAGMGLPSPAT